MRIFGQGSGPRLTLTPIRLQHVRARDAYERVVQENPNHAKVLQQLGWLYHQDGSFQNQDEAIQHLTKSLEADMCPSFLMVYLR